MAALLCLCEAIIVSGGRIIVFLIEQLRPNVLATEHMHASRELASATHEFSYVFDPLLWPF